MFGIGTSELMILVLALLIIGPKDLPRVGRELGKVYNTFRRAAGDVKESVTKEIEDMGKDIGCSIHEEEKEKKG